MNPQFPAADVDLSTWLATKSQLRSGDERAVDFLARLSRRLLAPAITRTNPELAVLGYFLRSARLRNMLDDVDGNKFPRGLVFHIPPTNVDTLFAYTWALSMLAGNKNIVRISPRSSGATETILDVLNDIDADPAITATQLMITYDRNDTLTAELSAACDLRVIWGGDDTIAALRQYQLSPHARDLAFPDRSSFAAISVAGWRSATPAERRIAVHGFHNDTHWFDQAACASPRTIFWIGEPAPDARAEFTALLAELVPPIDAAMAIRKQVATYGLAADGIATSIRFAGNAVATVDVTKPVRDWLASGTFPQLTLPALAALVPLIERRDQTLTHYGFADTELTDLATALNGRGVDRIVPFGSALTFDRVWDGYDLLTEFTRISVVNTTC